MRFLPIVFAVAAALASAPLHAAHYTYHGDLLDGDAPASGHYDLRVRTFAQSDAKGALGAAIELPRVQVSNGSFAIELDLPESPLGDTWVEVAVRKADSNDVFEVLGEPKLINKANNGCWALDGNTGMAAGSFLGNADPASDEPLILKARNYSVATFTPRGNSLSFGNAPSVLMGSPVNVASGIGATVAGGGGTRGAAGSACATCNNSATGPMATIGGGWSNVASGDTSTVSGGVDNETIGQYSTVAGGTTNQAHGFAGIAAGGQGNFAIGNHSIAAGGLFNVAGANGSFAAGRNSRVRIAGAAPMTPPTGLNSSDYAGVGGSDEGTFVWTDFDSAAFRSTGPNQFLLRAGGGVGVNTNSISASEDLVIAARAGADDDVSLNLRTTGGKLGWVRIFDPSGDTDVRSEHGNLTLATTTTGKYIHANDKFGVKTLPITNDLEVNGTASKSAAGAWLANSDRRIKRDIAPIDDALAMIMKVRPVTFRYEAQYRDAHSGLDDKAYFNVIAQEFAEVFPDAVKGSGEYLPGKAKSSENEILQVDTYPAQITAIAAIQELAVQDDAVRDEIAALKSENAELRAGLDALIKRIAQLETRKEH